MTVQLTADQEQRIQAIINSGAYETIQELVDAAIATVEQRTVPGFEGDEAELEALLLAGMNSPELSHDEFWNSVEQVTDAMLAEHKVHVHP